MNFVVSSKALLQQLQIVGGVVASNSNVPILNDFLFEVTDGALTIYGSDMETTISIRLTEVNTKKEGSIAIPAKLLLDTLKTFGDIPLTFTVDSKTGGVVLASDSGKYKLAGHNADDYPRMPQIDAAGSVSINSLALAQAVNKTSFATGNDELRPVMSGVLFELGPDGSNFVATDAHKLVRYKRKDVKASSIGSIILPKKPLNVLKGILTNMDVDVQINYNDSNVQFEFENIKVVSRLVEGKYPNYEVVIPKNNPNKLTVDKDPFLSAIRRVSIFSNKTTYQVRFKIAGSELQISAEDLDFSNEAYERLTCHYQGDDMEIGFNSKFLVEMLNNIESDQVVMEMSEPNRAGILTPSEYDAEIEEITMLVMPIMLNN